MTQFALRQAAMMFAPALALACSSCATRSASVDQRMILPDSAEHYEMQDRQTFMLPLPLENEPPAMPDLLGNHDLAPTTVCAEIVIDEAGQVTQVTPLHDADCGQGDSQAVVQLQQAMLSKLAQWHFDPAAVCTFATAEAAKQDDPDAACVAGRAERRNTAVKLAYAFTFEVRDGKRKVTDARIGGR
jgi:hypothetical protein